MKANNLSTSRKRSRNTLVDNGKAGQGDHADDSAWIHRDKLAQIEIQEMEAAGIIVRPSRRSMSADPGASRRSSRSASRSRKPMSEDSLHEPLPNGGRIASQDGYEGTQQAARGEQEFDPDIDTEFRTPEEIAAERNPAATQMPRPSTSRIPISKASPVPMPSTVVERDSPLPRSRHGSMSSGNWDEMQYARRARTSSIGSQVLLDEEPSTSDNSNKISSGEGSPTKARMPMKTPPKSGVRKGSAFNGVDRPGSARKPSTPASHRPGSRAGSAQKTGRPSTSHQYTPEGDPPWIDSMYKPDPRLPPDQQMLPTHAKRMMQEQWEKEGKSGTIYDRDLNLLTDKELPMPPSAKMRPPPLTVDPNSSNAADAWPLASSIDPDMPPPSPRPSTRGGLKLTPKISAPPSIHKATPPPAATMPTQSLRVPELDEKQEAQQKKGGCACCVVM